ncbi:DUF218 domain-containing protein [Cognatiyoonia koreensis]|uniref:DUF218 domain-containing protein n=1 Tax=Cognatiyoonia koreensis TaxID=364200 RepID=A0A1I0MVH3_9RHOB|nr:YdcF family protein [Cognatiyoonia koreensis]SEV92386.1 DUF218 domain-containing protein [Cognatiyoonia koreensis]
MQVILILGAAVWQDGPSPTMRRRCAHALSLWQMDRAQVLVPCGGLGIHAPAEAEIMRDIFIKAGVPAAQIIPEAKSRTTYENLRNARALLSRFDVTRVIIVSDRYHLPRARMVARHLGWQAETSGPSTRGGHRKTQIRNLAREAGAIPLYALKLWGHRLRGSDRR